MKPYYMTVGELIGELSQYNFDLPLRFHSLEQLNMPILSIYPDDDGTTIEIDVGKDT